MYSYAGDIVSCTGLQGLAGQLPALDRRSYCMAPVASKKQFYSGSDTSILFGTLVRRHCCLHQCTGTVRFASVLFVFLETSAMFSLC